MNQNKQMPVLIPIELDEFWEKMRGLVRQEMASHAVPARMGLPQAVPGLTERPFFKMSEVCALFQVSRQTIYEWIKAGKLNPVKIRSRVYFLKSNIDAITSGEQKKD